MIFKFFQLKCSVYSHGVCFSNYSHGHDFHQKYAVQYTNGTGKEKAIHFWGQFLHRYQHEAATGRFVFPRAPQ